jgi:hypothetical protein
MARAWWEPYGGMYIEIAAQHVDPRVTDPDGMETHVPFPFNENGQGPATDEDYCYTGCWCIDPSCPGPSVE